mmetsp:Transcript_67027/g.123537  ORF Transcript_67027/g.123537 Transcript_67027/m.123537 type:complete len:178 (+) Transcript_67027:81-614(+)
MASMRESAIRLDRPLGRIPRGFLKNMCPSTTSSSVCDSEATDFMATRMSAQARTTSRPGRFHETISTETTRSKVPWHSSTSHAKDWATENRFEQTLAPRLEKTLDPRMLGHLPRIDSREGRVFTGTSKPMPYAPSGPRQRRTCSLPSDRGLTATSERVFGFKPDWAQKAQKRAVGMR